jgi:predicted nucleic acid-binding Zn ribbon protein
MKCPKCQAPIEADSRFCGRCGQMIDKGGAAQPSSVVQPALTGAIPVAATAGNATAAPASAAGSTASAGLAVPSMARLIERIKNIVLGPKLEWLVIAPEPTSIAQLYTGYVMPLAAFAAAMSFLHMSLIGVSVPFAGVIRTPIASGLMAAILSFGLGLVGLFLVGLIINGLAPTFAGSSDRRQALKAAAYSFTPAWLSSVLALSPVLPTLLQWAALFYGIYVLYLGLPVLMRSPQERALGYTTTVVACTLLLGIVFLGVSVVAGRFGWGPGRLSSSPAAQAAAKDQGAASVGNIIGNALGTDDKGKAGLGAALSNLVKAGQSSETSSSTSATAANGNTAEAPANASAANSADAQSSVSAVGGLVTALGGALGGSHRVAVVDFKTLTAMLPSSLPGMTRTNAQGENQGAVGVKTSSAKADYQGDNGADVHIEISDISGVSGLMGLAGSLVQNTTSESASGFERDQDIGGRSVHEKYDAKAKKGDLSVIVAKRFEVDVAGDGVDMNTLEQSLGQVDLARLESMKEQGAQAQ